MIGRRIFSCNCCLHQGQMCLVRYLRAIKQPLVCSVGCQSPSPAPWTHSCDHRDATPHQTRPNTALHGCSYPPTAQGLGLGTFNCKLPVHYYRYLDISFLPINPLMWTSLTGGVCAPLIGLRSAIVTWRGGCYLPDMCQLVSSTDSPNGLAEVVSPPQQKRRGGGIFHNTAYWTLRLVAKIL